MEFSVSVNGGTSNSYQPPNTALDELIFTYVQVNYAQTINFVGFVREGKNKLGKRDEKLPEYISIYLYAKPCVCVLLVLFINIFFVGKLNFRHPFGLVDRNPRD